MEKEKGKKLPRPDQLEEYARQAPSRLRAIADDPETPVKLKAEIEKFFYEAVYGKTPLSAESDGRGDGGATVIRFEGQLEQWSG